MKNLFINNAIGTRAQKLAVTAALKTKYPKTAFDIVLKPDMVIFVDGKPRKTILAKCTAISRGNFDVYVVV